MVVCDGPIPVKWKCLKEVLEGSEEMERLLGSCFGHLFRLPVRRCTFSAKLVHVILTRQLITKKRFEMWLVFGGEPMRFSLMEFGNVTRLPCGEFEDGYVIDFRHQPRRRILCRWPMC